MVLLQIVKLCDESTDPLYSKWFYLSPKVAQNYHNSLSVFIISSSSHLQNILQEENKGRLSFIPLWLPDQSVSETWIDTLETLLNVIVLIME